MSEALQALVGTEVSNLSASVVLKLKEEWARELRAWRHRDLAEKEYVYWWADGIHFTIRLDSDDRQCILVLIGATKDGRKELVAVQDGFRESQRDYCWRRHFEYNPLPKFAAPQPRTAHPGTDSRHKR